jgi:hypothetical protein
MTMAHRKSLLHELVLLAIAAMRYLTQRFCPLILHCF